MTISASVPGSGGWQSLLPLPDCPRKPDCAWDMTGNPPRMECAACGLVDQRGTKFLRALLANIRREHGYY